MRRLLCHVSIVLCIVNIALCLFFNIFRSEFMSWLRCDVFENKAAYICFAVVRVAIEMNNFWVWGCERLRVSELSSSNYSNSDRTWMQQWFQQDNTVKMHLHLTSIMCWIYQVLIGLWIFCNNLLILFLTATILLMLSICLFCLSYLGGKIKI